MPTYRCQVQRADGSRARRAVAASSRDEAEAAVRDAGETLLEIGDPTPTLAARVAGLRPMPRPLVRLDPPAERRSAVPIVAALLLSIPLTTTVLAVALTAREAAETARLRQSAAPQLAALAATRAAAAARPGVAAALGGRSVSELLGRIGRILPTGTALASAARADDRTLRLEIDTSDPEALRAALAGDPVLGALRTTGETVIADRGMRVLLGGRVG